MSFIRDFKLYPPPIIYLCPWCDRLVNRCDANIHHKANFDTHLTLHQLEILLAFATGLTNCQVSDKFNISPQTIKNTLHSIYSHLDVPNITSAVIKCLQNYAFDLDDVTLVLRAETQTKAQTEYENEIEVEYEITAEVESLTA